MKINLRSTASGWDLNLLFRNIQNFFLLLLSCSWAAVATVHWCKFKYVCNMHFCNCIWAVAWIRTNLFLYLTMHSLLEWWKDWWVDWLIDILIACLASRCVTRYNISAIDVAFERVHGGTQSQNNVSRWIPILCTRPADVSSCRHDSMWLLQVVSCVDVCASARSDRVHCLM